MEDKQSNSNLILDMLKRHEEQISLLKNGLILNEERDKRRDEDIIELRKEVRQNTTSINTLLDAIGGENGLVNVTDRTRADMNKTTGVLALVSVIGLTIGGWFFYQYMEDRKETIQLIKEVYTLKAIAKDR